MEKCKKGKCVWKLVDTNEKKERKMPRIAKSNVQVTVFFRP